MLDVAGVWTTFSHRVLLQAEPQSVEIPLFPLLISVGGLVAVVLVSLSALRMPKMRPRRERPEPRQRPKTAPVAEITMEPALPPPAPVYKKAPISIFFPMIKSQFPDVIGVNERAVIVFRVEDKALLSQREVPGLAARIGAQDVPLVFFKGEARIDQVFDRPQEAPVTVDLRVRGEKQPRRTTRLLRVVKYREEIADLFAEFREEVSRLITPLRPDATPWEIYDAVLDAKPNVSQMALREIVSSFEEAKFSNHPVGRPTYEKMVLALRAFKPTEG